MRRIERLAGARLYLDSDVFIYALESPDRIQRAQHLDLIRAMSSGHCTACTSVLTRAEVLARPLRLRQVALADEYRRMFSADGFTQMLALNADIMDRAAALHADYPALRLPDALHVASAVVSACNAFVSNDLRFATCSARIPVFTPAELLQEEAEA